jgi:hypothetical protein
MDEINYSFKPTEQVPTFNFKPNYNISFHNNSQEIGKMDFNGPALVFTGDAEESAKVFIDWIARNFAARLEEERKAEREACAKVCEEAEVVQTTYCMTLHDEGAETLRNAAAAIRARGNI